MTTPCLSRRAVRRAAALSGTLAGSLALVAMGVAVAPGAGASVLAPDLEAQAATPTVQPAGASGSTFIGGYQDTPDGGLASASATFTIPKVTCTAAAKADSALVEFGVFTGTGTGSVITASCSSTGATYSYFENTPTGSDSEPGAAPGDTIVASLFESSSSTWGKIHDLTNGQYWYDNEFADPGDTNVYIGIVDNPIMPTFTPFTFSNVTVNSDYLGFEAPQRFNMVNAGGGTVLVKSGKLKTTAAGSSFSLTFEHAD